MTTISPKLIAAITAIAIAMFAVPIAEPISPHPRPQLVLGNPHGTSLKNKLAGLLTTIVQQAVQAADTAAAGLATRRLIPRP